MNAASISPGVEPRALSGVYDRLPCVIEERENSTSIRNSPPFSISAIMSVSGPSEDSELFLSSWFKYPIRSR